MGFLHTAMAAGAALLFYTMDQSGWMIAAIVVALGSFWSHGVMHNHAVNHAKLRNDYDGGFYSLTEADLEAVPDSLTLINMIFAIGSLVLLGVAVWMKWF